VLFCLDAVRHNSRPLRPLRGRGFLLVASLLVLPGCDHGAARPEQPSPPVAAGDERETLAPGIVHEAISTGASAGVDIIDVTMSTADAHVSVGASSIGSSDGSVTAAPKLPEDWLTDQSVLAAINGGYFGRTVNEHKELVGLLVMDGRVRHAAPAIVGHGSAGLAPGTYARSAFGVMPNGEPQITWAATRAGSPQSLYSYEAPIISDSHGQRIRGTRWRPVCAIGCGPTLIRDGRVSITDRDERLVSPEACPRTFVAYSSPGASQHFVMGVASSMTYNDLAQFLEGYFKSRYKMDVSAAMCLDGGASTQISYRTANGPVTPRSTGVTVADCLLLVSGRQR